MYLETTHFLAKNILSWAILWKVYNDTLAEPPALSSDGILSIAGLPKFN